MALGLIVLSSPPWGEIRPPAEGHASGLVQGRIIPMSWLFPGTRIRPYPCMQELHVSHDWNAPLLGMAHVKPQHLRPRGKPLPGQEGVSVRLSALPLPQRVSASTRKRTWRWDSRWTL